MRVRVFSVHVSEHACTCVHGNCVQCACLSMRVRVCTRMMVTVFSVHVSEHACTCVHAHDGNCVQCAFI